MKLIIKIYNEHNTIKSTIYKTTTQKHVWRATAEYHGCNTIQQLQQQYNTHSSDGKVIMMSHPDMPTYYRTYELQDTFRNAREHAIDYLEQHKDEYNTEVLQSAKDIIIKSLS